jgi:hypothetical protein
MDRLIFMCLGVSLIVLTACSEKQIYKGFQERNRVDCMTLPLPQQEDCLKEVESPRYEDYMREREQESQ